MCFRMGYVVYFLLSCSMRSSCDTWVFPRLGLLKSADTRWCGVLFFSAAYVLRINGHIKVDFMTYYLSQATKNMLDVLNYLFILGYTLLILFSSGMNFFDAIAMNERSSSLLKLHMGWLYGGIVIGCILLALQTLLFLVKAICLVSHARPGKKTTVLCRFTRSRDSWC